MSLATGGAVIVSQYIGGKKEALAVYNAGAALYRSIGKTSVTMYISVIANIINIIGNIVCVFVLHMGVAGVAYPSNFYRMECCYLCSDPNNYAVL